VSKVEKMMMMMMMMMTIPSNLTKSHQDIEVPVFSEEVEVLHLFEVC